MFRKILIVAALGLALTAFPCAQTLDDVLAKAIEAQGGEEALRSMNSMKAVGELILQGGAASGEIRVFQMRPNKIRSEVNFMGMTIIQSFDGEDAWQIRPAAMQGTGAPESMSERERKDFVMSADIDGLLLDYEKKGHEIELVGAEDMEGTEVHHLKITHKNGRVLDQYYDVETGLLLKNVSTQFNPQMGQDMEFTQYFGDYKEVEGAMVPHSIDTQAMGQTIMQIVFEEFSVNPDLDPSIFARPAEE